MITSLKYDRPIQYAVGQSRQSLKWKNTEKLWSELAERLKTPTRTPETFAEYAAFPKPKRDEIKDVGGFVGGTLRSGRRKPENILDRQLLTLDIDTVPEGVDPWDAVELVLGCAAVLYSTHSHTGTAPRLRLVMPLSRPVTPDEYTALAHRVAGDIGIDMCDDTTYQPHRLMYWPSAALDAPYRYELSDAPWLDVDEQLARYHDWTDSAQWPVSSRKHDMVTRLAKKQGDPLAKPGYVGSFCRVYSVDEAIREFLPSIYTPCDIPNRYTYTAGSTAGGLIVYEDGRYAYSHHGTDPASGKLCNSFDLVRLHMFGSHDDDALPETRGNRLPSYLAMIDLIRGDEAVTKDMVETRLAEVVGAFADAEMTDEQQADLDKLKGALSINSKGIIESTIDNVYVILLYDPRIKGTFYHDTFRDRPIVCGDLPWQDLDTRATPCWEDTDDSGLRWYLERKYGISNVLKVRDAVEQAMNKNKRHPVREYLNGLDWDGKPRADTLFIDYLGAADTEYTRAVTRCALLGAVARAFQPGCKHDHALVLVGPQGSMKSTILARLGGEWFSDSLYTVTGKDAYEQLQGAWIIELGEMAATRKAELEQIKHFISKQVDSYRAAYARRTQDHPRQCSFWGSTNDAEFLRDATGNRRFWPVVVTTKGRESIIGLTKGEVNQVWAEIVVAYKKGEKWYLTEAVEAQAREIQSMHTEVNSKEGVIEEFLNRPLPSDWATRELESRKLFWSGSFGEKEIGTEPRQTVCALELWQELFEGDRKSFTYQQARELTTLLRNLPDWEAQPTSTRYGMYGKQRIFIHKLHKYTDEDLSI